MITPAILQPTRDKGLARLTAFLPNAGRRYAETRNFDHGPAHRTNVSMLSPWIRHRLVREDEVVGAVLDRHGEGAAEKFIQEVIWRTYWKGWLEMRPAVWECYRSAVQLLFAAMDRDAAGRSRWQNAVEGRTGIACFDSWANELIEYGYLHNHARMWFASIWIFTLKLPWELGADFFLRYLLDGDPASNTLSWRWVAGLQTPGKTYLARAANIEKFTAGRFSPGKELATVAVPSVVPATTSPVGLRATESFDSNRPTGLLITEEDCHPESLPLPRCVLKAAAAALVTRQRSPLGAGALPISFARGAVEDALHRFGRSFDGHARVLEAEDLDRDLIDWARASNIRQIVTAFAPVGPTRQWLDESDPAWQTLKSAWF